MVEFKGTTILAVRRDGKCAVAGDGQVTLGEATVMKHKARKVRRIHDGKVVVGFAGTVADAFALEDRFEAKLSKHGGNLKRSAVALAREWRADKVLRTLDALLIVADGKDTLIISGSGEVIEPDDGVAAIGSGSMYALSAARALMKHSTLSASEIARESLLIASDICVYTNSNINVEEV